MIKIGTKTITLYKLTEIAQVSNSKRNMLMRLGIPSVGKNFKQLNEAILKHNIDISHFCRTWSKPNLHELLTENSSYPPYHLKTRLIKEGLLTERCEICGITEWLGKPMTFIMDHINGNHYDNRLENLRLICPNCDTQTDTYMGRNHGRYDNV